MTTPSKQARERCAELANAEGGVIRWRECDFTEAKSIPQQAFARYVQQVHEVICAFLEDADQYGVSPPFPNHLSALQSLILPEAPDPLEEALASAWPGCTGELVATKARIIREALKRHGGRIVFDGDTP